MNIATKAATAWILALSCSTAQAAPQGSIECAALKMTPVQRASFAAAITSPQEESSQKAASEMSFLARDYANQCAKVYKWNEAQIDTSTEYVANFAMRAYMKTQLKLSDAAVLKATAFVAEKKATLKTIETFTVKERATLLHKLTVYGVNWSGNSDTDYEKLLFINALLQLQDLQTKFAAG
jgi:hypothetical protein